MEPAAAAARTAALAAETVPAMTEFGPWQHLSMRDLQTVAQDVKVDGRSTPVC